MKHMCMGIVGLALAVSLTVTGAEADKKEAPRKPAPPSVLVVGNVHAKYFVQPLTKLEVEVDTCTKADLNRRLNSGLYNVLVLPSAVDQELLAVAEAFLAKGGGVFEFQPSARFDDLAGWNLHNAWLAKLGAPRRWEVLSDAQGAVDSLNVRLSYSTAIVEPVNDGVTGVWTLAPDRLKGASWPMTYNFDANWKVVVRGGPTLVARPATEDPVERVKPFIPKEPLTGEAVSLLGMRDFGGGRVALLALASEWMLAPPPNCPTAEAMLTKGVDGKESGWSRLLANTFRWLAEPSQAAGWGGIRTPLVVAQPPGSVAENRATFDWSKPSPDPTVPAMGDQPQIAGLIGARTVLSGAKGTVADYVAEAKKAGLSYIVFLEDGLKLDQGKWDDLVKQCAAASDDKFAAFPGLTYEDAQGNHMYAFGDNARFPQPNMVLPDGRLATIHVSRTENVFNYVLELMKLRTPLGFWRHQENYLHFADYKLYNTFPIYTFEDGKPIDDAFDIYMHWMGFGGCQGVLAFEIMNDPGQVAGRAKDGWKVVATIAENVSDGTYRPISLPKGVEGLRKKWSGALGWWPPYQYITNGPKILSWDCQNICAMTRGEWWRPDVWQYRVGLRVTADAGLKSVTILDGDRGVFRRWAPAGKAFATTLVLENCQQRDLVLVVEDVNGRKAISMEIWNRNLMANQFICGDRCNFLGNSRLRSREGAETWIPVGLAANLGVSPSKGATVLTVQPDISLTPSTPTLPTDGQPFQAKYTIQILDHRPIVPGELDHPFSFPTTHLIGPEVAIGQANYSVGYDPAEIGAKKTPLGHDYLEPEKQGRIGYNAWTSWYRLVPLKKLSGWARICSGSWIAGELRSGWLEVNWTLIDDLSLANEKNRGFFVARLPGDMMKGDQALAAGPEGGLPFSRGTYCIAPTGLAFAMDGSLRAFKTPHGWDLYFVPEKAELKKGDTIRFRFGFAGAPMDTPRARLLQFAAMFGIAQPGQTGYTPTQLQGKLLDNCLVLRLDGAGTGVTCSFARTDLPGMLTATVEGLNDNWSVQLLDRKRRGPNHRGLPIRDGVAYAALDLTQADSDLFIGHPVVCDRRDARLLVAWKQSGQWAVEVHNPTDAPMPVSLRSAPGWTRFTLAETANLPPGSSRTWTVKEP